MNNTAGLTLEQTLIENVSEFKIQMTLFLHDMPELPVTSAMDAVAFIRANEILSKFNEAKKFAFKTLNEL